MSRRWLSGLACALGICAGFARAEEATWRPVIARTPAAAPAATLGKPVPLAGGAAAPPVTDSAVTPASFSAPAAAIQRPVIRAQAPDVPPPGVPAVPPVPPGPPPGLDGPPPAPVPPAGWMHQIFDGGWLGCCDGQGRQLFQSDHCFDGFISPVTSPFLFEDPRSLTELRPIFIWQQTSTKAPFFRGGDIEHIDLQARVAITERLSLVMDGFGWTWIETHDPSDEFHSQSAFHGIHLGPKYTFLRNEQTGTLGALGLTFEVPANTNHGFDQSGSLRLRPYVTMGQNFGRSSYGSFNVLGTLGGDFATNGSGSDFVFAGLHLDFDVANAHKIYPLMELNWADYTSNGKAHQVNFEGRDLFNVGATQVSGQNELTLAFGARYKFSECIQTGIAAEFPLTGQHRLDDFRLTIDLIFRY